MRSSRLRIVRQFFREPEIQQWLLAEGTRDDIIEWLVWNDGNGVYSDIDSEAEDYPLLTLETAREAMRRVLDQQ